MRHYRMPCLKKLTCLALCQPLLVTLILTPSVSYSAPNCNPHSIAGRAVAGQLFNELLGGFNKIIGAAAGIDNRISPTPSSLMTDCILPALNPPRRQEPDEDPHPVRRPAGGWGDPHLITHDGLGFGFQGAGDYAYVESDNLIVQARQFRLSQDASVSRIKAFAVKTDQTTIVINDPVDSSLINSEPGLVDVITVNGEDIPIGIGGWIDLDTQGSYVMRFRRHTYLQIEGKLRLLISRNGNSFRLLLDESLQGQVSGLLGNFDGDSSNDLQTASGDIFSIGDVDTLYGSYLDDWIRQGDASLFTSAYDVADEGNIRPGEPRLLSGIDLPTREAAAQRCLAAGVSPGFALHGCIHDMIFDEDTQWLSDAADVSVSGFRVTAAAAITPTDTTDIALDANADVSPGQPSEGAGVIANSGDVDLFSLSLSQGTARLLQASEPCSAAQPFSLQIRRNGADTQEYPLECNTSIPLPEGELTLAVFSHGADTGEYAFAIREPAVVDAGAIGLDTLIQGSLSGQERLVANLPSTNGDRIFLVSSQEENCAQLWQLVDSSGGVIKRTSACLDLGAVTIGSDAPYSVQILPGAPTTYGFTAVSVSGNTVVSPDTNRRFDLIITTPGQQASGEFSLIQGERIYVDRDGGVLSGNLVVTGPGGDEVARTGASEEDVQFEAPDTGNYTVTLQPRDSFTGTVPVSLIAIADDTRIDVERGQTFSLTLTTPGQRASAAFTVEEGDSFTVSATTTNTVTGISIIPFVLTPDVDFPISIFGSRTITASEAGTYQIVIVSSEVNRFTGTVEFQLD